MTAIKQVSVTTSAHAANLGRYLNDGRALARSSQNLTNEDNWEKEMAQTRAAYGHDVPSRAGAANVLLVHQVLAINPDECSCNGGIMTPERCMAYARDYVSTRYPNHEAIWVLHKEHCTADNTDRYAVHIGINRTDLETGKRLNEGPSRYAKVERANAVRDMDRKYGLTQLRAGERNSRIHARQPSKAEREMIARGIRSDKSYIRDAIRASIKEVHHLSGSTNKLRDLAASLKEKGVKMTPTHNGKDFTFERLKTATKCRGYKLGRNYGAESIVKSLGLGADKTVDHSIGEEMER